MSVLLIYDLGTKGVMVDNSPLSNPDGALVKAQNAISDPLGNATGISSRPGLEKFNSEVANGSILGGIGVPLANLKTGSRFFYIGRGPRS